MAAVVPFLDLFHRRYQQSVANEGNENQKKKKQKKRNPQKRETK